VQYAPKLCEQLHVARNLEGCREQHIVSNLFNCIRMSGVVQHLLLNDFYIYVLLAVHLSIILVINQLNAQILLL